MSEIYYRIYVPARIPELATIVTMQHFDERDYTQSRFLINQRFEYEWEAVDWLNENVRQDKIDPEFMKFDKASFLK
jgi:hypothetical protein